MPAVTRTTPLQNGDAAAAEPAPSPRDNTAAAEPVPSATKTTPLQIGEDDDTAAAQPVPSTSGNTAAAQPVPSQIDGAAAAEPVSSPRDDAAAARHLGSERAVRASRGLPLADQEMQFAVALLNESSDQTNRVVCMSTNPNITIETKALQCLHRRTWLSGDVINTYLDLIETRSKRNGSGPTVFVYNTFMTQLLSKEKKLERLSRRQNKGVSLQLCDIALIPCWVGKNHWCLLVYDFGQKTIRWFDPFRSIAPETVKLVSEYFRDEAKRQAPHFVKNGPRPDHFDLTSIKACEPADQPEQRNGSDCGVHLCWTANCLADGMKSFQLTEREIDMFRLRMVLELEKLCLFGTTAVGTVATASTASTAATASTASTASTVATASRASRASTAPDVEELVSAYEILCFQKGYTIDQSAPSPGELLAGCSHAIINVQTTSGRIRNLSWGQAGLKIDEHPSPSGATDFGKPGMTRYCPSECVGFVAKGGTFASAIPFSALHGAAVFFDMTTVWRMSNYRHGCNCVAFTLKMEACLFAYPRQIDVMYSSQGENQHTKIAEFYQERLGHTGKTEPSCDEEGRSARSGDDLLAAVHSGKPIPGVLQTHIRQEVATEYRRRFSLNCPEDHLRQIVIMDRMVWDTKTGDQVMEDKDILNAFLESTTGNRWGDHYDITLFSELRDRPVIVFRRSEVEIIPAVLIGRARSGLPIMLLQTHPHEDNRAHFSVLIPVDELYSDEFEFATTQISNSLQDDSWRPLLVKWTNRTTGLFPIYADGNCLFGAFAFLDSCVKSEIKQVKDTKTPMPNSSQEAFQFLITHSLGGRPDLATNTSQEWEVLPSRECEDSRRGNVHSQMPLIDRSKIEKRLDVRMSKDTFKTKEKTVPFLSALAEMLLCPLIVRWECDNEPCWSVHGSNHPGLPAVLLHQNRWLDSGAFSAAFPLVDGYKRQFEAALRLVEYHPILVTMSEQNTILPDWAVFPMCTSSDHDGSGLLEAIELQRLCRDEKYQEGGVHWNYVLHSHKYCSQGVTQRLSMLRTDDNFEIGRETRNQQRRIASTTRSGNAFDTGTPMSSVKRNLARDDHGVSTNLAGTVLLDCGAGIGDDLFPQFVCSTKAIVLGFEKEYNLHKSLLSRHANLISNGVSWKGSVVTRNINAHSVDDFTGVTHVSLYDGSPPNRQDRVVLTNEGHLPMIKKILATLTLLSLTSTKLQPRVLKRYIELDANIGKLADQFYPVKLMNMPFTTSKMKSWMWVRKKRFRVARDVTPVLTAKLTRADERTVVQEMLLAADYEAQKPDDHGRFVSITSYPGTKFADTSLVKSVRDLWSDLEIPISILVGAEVFRKLTGHQLCPGECFDVQSDNDTWSGYFLGIVPDPDSKTGDEDRFVCLSQPQDEIRVVSLRQMKRSPLDDLKFQSIGDLQEFIKKLPVFFDSADSDFFTGPKRRRSKRLRTSKDDKDKDDKEEDAEQHLQQQQEQLQQQQQQDLIPEMPPPETPPPEKRRANRPGNTSRHYKRTTNSSSPSPQSKKKTKLDPDSDVSVTMEELSVLTSQLTELQASVNGVQTIINDGVPVAPQAMSTAVNQIETEIKGLEKLVRKVKKDLGTKFTSASDDLRDKVKELIAGAKESFTKLVKEMKDELRPKLGQTTSTPTTNPQYNTWATVLDAIKNNVQKMETAVTESQSRLGTITKGYESVAASTTTMSQELQTLRGHTSGFVEQQQEVLSTVQKIREQEGESKTTLNNLTTLVQNLKADFDKQQEKRGVIDLLTTFQANVDSTATSTRNDLLHEVQTLHNNHSESMKRSEIQLLSTNIQSEFRMFRKSIQVDQLQLQVKWERYAAQNSRAEMQSFHNTYSDKTYKRRYPFNSRLLGRHVADDLGYHDPAEGCWGVEPGVTGTWPGGPDVCSDVIGASAPPSHWHSGPPGGAFAGAPPGHWHSGPPGVAGGPPGAAVSGHARAAGPGAAGGAFAGGPPGAAVSGHAGAAVSGRWHAGHWHAGAAGPGPPPAFSGGPPDAAVCGHAGAAGPGLPGGPPGAAVCGHAGAAGPGAAGGVFAGGPSDAAVSGHAGATVSGRWHAGYWHAGAAEPVPPPAFARGPPDAAVSSHAGAVGPGAAGGACARGPPGLAVYPGHWHSGPPGVAGGPPGAAVSGHAGAAVSGRWHAGHWHGGAAGPGPPLADNGGPPGGVSWPWHAGAAGPGGHWAVGR